MKIVIENINFANKTLLKLFCFTKFNFSHLRMYKPLEVSCQDISQK